MGASPPSSAAALATYAASAPSPAEAREPARFPLWRQFLAYYTRTQDRSHLRELDDRMLRDIGLTREQVSHGFWHVIDES